jgi:hypothetical protein
MSEPRSLRCYQYVNRPYDAVRELLCQHPRDVFQRATTTAAARADAIFASLHVVAGGLDVGVPVDIHVSGFRNEPGIAGLPPRTRIKLVWKARRDATLFPVMDADLSLWALTSTETQLELEGAYTPPLGIVGHAIDVAVGHRVAEATVHRFLDDVAEQIRRELSGAAAYGAESA